MYVAIKTAKPTLSQNNQSINHFLFANMKNSVQQHC